MPTRLLAACLPDYWPRAQWLGPTRAQRRRPSPTRLQASMANTVAVDMARRAAQISCAAAGILRRRRGLHHHGGGLPSSLVRRSTRSDADLARRALPRRRHRLHRGGLPPTLHHGGMLHYGGLPTSLVCRSARSSTDPARQALPRPCPDPAEARPNPADTTAAGSIGLAWVFFKLINGGGQLNATASINRLTEAGIATASR